MSTHPAWVERRAEQIHQFLRPVTKRVSLAARVAILTTGAVALTLSSISAVIYVTTRSQIIGALDDSMIKKANAAIEGGYTPSTISAAELNILNLMGIQIVVVEGGQAFTQKGDSFPYDLNEQEVAIGQSTHSARTAIYHGVPYRVVAVQAGPGQAFVLAQSMDSVKHALDRLTLTLIAASTVGVALAGIAGWAVASNGLRPVRRLTAATERVARTNDLTPIETAGSTHDELARLTRSFNSMLLALSATQARERQLIADAGHELRTPLTSLRTNIDLLRQVDDDTARTLQPGAKRELLDDIRAQLDELSQLVGDLTELARDEPLHRDPEPLDLVDVALRAVERVRLRAPDITFETDLGRSMVIGDSQLLERAVTNLLDNAAKWSPVGSTVTVTLRDGRLDVADEGPGIAAADLPHVFDRFYRSAEARTLPGSGLGLSIVRRAADRHGGDVSVVSTPGEGSTFTFRVPPADASPT